MSSVFVHEDGSYDCSSFGSDFIDFVKEESGRTPDIFDLLDRFAVEVVATALEWLERRRVEEDPSGRIEEFSYAVGLAKDISEEEPIVLAHEFSELIGRSCELVQRGSRRTSLGLQLGVGRYPRIEEAIGTFKVVVRLARELRKASSIRDIEAIAAGTINPHLERGMLNPANYGRAKVLFAADQLLPREVAEEYLLSLAEPVEVLHQLYGGHYPRAEALTALIVLMAMAGRETPLASRIAVVSERDVTTISTFFPSVKGRSVKISNAYPGEPRWIPLDDHCWWSSEDLQVACQWAEEHYQGAMRNGCHILPLEVWR